MSVLPIFTSAYSFKSILTLDKPSDIEEGGPDSIVQICKDEGIKTLYLVEDNMVGLLEAKKNCGKDVQLAFGLRLTFCADITVKTPESKKTECKYIIFARNAQGYFRLNQIFTKSNLEGFFGQARMDFKTLKEFWNEDDLILVIPFYDSFIFNNTTTLSNCIPDFTYANPTFFIEDNNLYFDDIILQAIESFDTENKYEKTKAKSIYYRNRKDFLAWQTYKCIMNESTLRVPNLDNCASDEFCIESWKEVNK